MLSGVTLRGSNAGPRVSSGREPYIVRGIAVLRYRDRVGIDEARRRATGDAATQPLEGNATDDRRGAPLSHRGTT
jgi:hypothetical protein